MNELLYVFAGIFGLVIGSFLNVVIWRGPIIWGLVDQPSEKMNLAWPPSLCPACKTRIKALHLIPLLGFMLLRGKCAACDASVSVRYPIVEVMGALAAMLALSQWGLTPAGFAAFIFFCFCIALAAIDQETTFLPDALTLPLIALGLIINIWATFTPFLDALIGAVVGYAVFWLIGFYYEHRRGQNGLGQGDAKMLAAIGAWLGWPALPFAVLIAALAGIITVGVLMLIGKKKVQADTAIPFGPYLSGAASLLLWLQPQTPYF
jgi:leader peptidase (prepilin peptidase)/N-methyltransferase